MPAPELTNKNVKYRRRQRYVMPLVVIVIAIGFTYWSSRQQAGDRSEIRHHLLDTCTQIMQGGDPASVVIADSDVKRDGYLDTLRGLLEPLDDPSQVRIEVETGDSSPYADGRATHTACIFLHDAATLGVRIIRGDDDLNRIIGYWLVGPG